jgi:hypothetical protein
MKRERFLKKRTSQILLSKLNHKKIAMIFNILDVVYLEELDLNQEFIVLY